MVSYSYQSYILTVATFSFCAKICPWDSGFGICRFLENLNFISTITIFSRNVHRKLRHNRGDVFVLFFFPLGSKATFFFNEILITQLNSWLHSSPCLSSRLSNDRLASFLCVEIFLSLFSFFPVSFITVERHEDRQTDRQTEVAFC